MNWRIMERTEWTVAERTDCWRTADYRTDCRLQGQYPQKSGTTRSHTAFLYRNGSGRSGSPSVIWLLLPTFGFNEQLQGKIVALLGFIAISILIGMWWDWKTYRWNKDTRMMKWGLPKSVAVWPPSANGPDMKWWASPFGLSFSISSTIGWWNIIWHQPAYKPYWLPFS